MRKDRLFILAVFVLLLGLWLAFPLLGVSGTAATPPARAEASTAPAAVGEFRGISLQLHNGEATHPYEQYIDEIAATGANTLSLIVTAYQENCASTSIFIEARKTPSPERLKDLIRYAHKKGLRVLLMPIVLLENPREGEWRGKINPPNWDEWWDRYDSYVLHYARIAEEAGVEMFMIGSELVSTETQTDRWKNLIRQVRKDYRGLLSYSSNWDHYKVIKFWGDLDAVGMTTYYDLTGDKKPTPEVLLEAWRPIRKEILEWQAKINRPLIFTEVGWPNQETAAQYPWDYYLAMDKPAPKIQAMCFESFFKTWADEKAVAGCLIWEWRNNGDMGKGPKDPGYFPTEPAMKVIKAYFAGPSPTQTARPCISVSRPATEPADEADLQDTTDDLPEMESP